MKSAKINLRGPVYRYNPATCRYERTGTSFWGVLTYASGLALCAAAMLIGMLLLHDLLNESPAEIAYRKENQALEKHAAILTKQVESVEGKLAQLHDKDHTLHQKFFASSPDNPGETSRQSRSSILLGNADSFRKVMKEIDNLSNELIKTSASTNEAFSQVFAIDKNSLAVVPSLPIYKPVKNITTENLLSGFGKRVHPFHKGVYDHPGIDISLPRGTEIFATAAGTITVVKRSDLQAGYGNYVEIDHGNGFATRYAHLEESKVRVGQRVERGALIAISGNSGGSVAPHLHYEIIRDGKNIDPIHFMIQELNTTQYEALLKTSSTENQSLD